MEWKKRGNEGESVWVMGQRPLCATTQTPQLISSLLCLVALPFLVFIKEKTSAAREQTNSSLK